DAVASQHASNGGGKVLRMETFVVAHNHAHGGLVMVLDVGCVALCCTLHSIKGVILGNNATPPVGSKADIFGHSTHPCKCDFLYKLIITERLPNSKRSQHVSL